MRKKPTKEEWVEFGMKLNHEPLLKAAQKLEYYIHEDRMTARQDVATKEEKEMKEYSYEILSAVYFAAVTYIAVLMMGV